jgi:dipeptidyl aminopeptidase/acylaminoacyl peptidase
MSAAAPAHRTLNEIANLFRQGDTSIVTDDSIYIGSYPYKNDSFNVEAILVKPPHVVKAPAVILIPGYDLTAADFVPKAVRFAQAGLVCLTISEPGFGRSEGKPDFCGPNTLKAISIGIRKLLKETWIDDNRLGIMGYSRGATTASLLATRRNWFRAAAFVGGIYDLKQMFDNCPVPDIKAAIAGEMDTTDAEFKKRSSLLDMDKLNCPVLIVHGASDINSPPTQALSLRALLDKLHKPYEFHLLGVKSDPGTVKSPLELAVAFFQKILIAVN